MICRIPKQEDLYDLSDNIIYVDVPKIIADKKVQMYLGAGIEFKHTNKEMHKLWDEFTTLNNFSDLMYLTEVAMSTDGAKFVTLSRNKDGKCLLNLVQPYFDNRVAESYANEVCAKITEALYIGQDMFLVQSFYDDEKIVRTMWNGTNTSQINIGEYYTKIPEELRPEWGTFDKKTNSYTYYHNFGFVPVCVMKNKPFKHYFPTIMGASYYQSPFTTTWNYQTSGWTYDSIKDTAKCTGLILQLQNLYTQKWKLSLLDKPRVILNGVTQGLKNGLMEQRQKSLTSRFMSDLIVNAGFGGANGAGMQIMSPTNNLSNYDDAISNMWREIFNLSGLSFQVHTATQKTATESFSNHQESLETLNFMRCFHTNQWISLIRKAFLIMGQDLGDSTKWSFQVKRNVVIDEATQITNLIAEVQAGVTTPVEWIAIRKGVDEDNAKQIWENNKQWFEKNDYQISMQGGVGVAGTNQNPGKLDKGGRPESKGE